MNTEELELSLRSEFESYLKNARAEMRREAAEFQSRVESELDEQKRRLDEAFQAYSARWDSEPEFDEAFSGSVAEHLRLARDEGARIAATASEEAAMMAQEAAPAPAYDAIRDAVRDISSKESQSAILKSLIAHAEQFAPRGAFFIIKSEHFVGWKVFGAESESAESKIREIHFPMSGDSILGAATRSLVTVESSAGDGDAVFLEPLQFGRPDRMYAMPLVARHRGVAVLYADHGDEGASLNREALETLVSVAGLTVELLASTQTAKAEDRHVTADFEDARHDSDDDASAMPDQRFDETIRDMPAPDEASVPAHGTADFAFSESVSYEGGFSTETEAPREIEPQQPSHEAAAATETFVDRPWEEPAAKYQQSQASDEHAPFRYDEAQASAEDAAPEYEESLAPEHSEPAYPDFESAKTDPGPFPGIEESGGAIQFDSGGSIEPASVGSSPFDVAAPAYEPAAALGGTGFSQVAEPVVETPAVPPPRLSDRPVDLPIEVPDEERRIHNDARRFARLLVSEIKLYNEKKVIEGREASDLYERLREAIDRSREMYDKRVQPPVAAKFDYFHYEVVNALAEGNAERLGPSYPGSRV